MRKGSTDHLALDISGESDNLINRVDKDDDKGNYEFLIFVNFLIWKFEDLIVDYFAGHVFKSLNTSGFVPKQGKLIADRIDGLW